MSRYRVVLAAGTPPARTAEAFAGLPALLGVAGHPVSAVVEVGPADAEGRRSTWTLHLGRGAGVWTQHDEVAPDGRAGRGVLVDGPFGGLELAWAVRDDGAGSLAEIDLDLQTGMAHLAGALDAVIARVLLRAVHVASGTELGPVTLREGADVLADPRADDGFASSLA